MKAALARARALSGEVTGSLVQEEVTTAWTLGRIAREGREAGPSNSDTRTRVLEIQAAGLSVEPRANARVLFTGSTDTWAVLESEPIAPGGTVVAWRLSLIDKVSRED